MFCSQPQSTPLPMYELAKHSPLMLAVANNAGIGTPLLDVRAKMRGASGGVVVDRL